MPSFNNLNLLKEKSTVSLKQQTTKQLCEEKMASRIANNSNLNLIFDIPLNKIHSTLLDYAKDDEVSLEKFSCYVMSMFYLHNKPWDGFSASYLITKAGKKPELSSLTYQSATQLTKNEIKNTFSDIRQITKDAINGIIEPVVQHSFLGNIVNIRIFCNFIIIGKLNDLSQKIQEYEQIPLCTILDLLLLFHDLKFE
ncbi:hypothetical protein AB837_00415 [bacterium AB1]|nr:hypothetical protein AB837_00415 [bacterium AB1]